ncbi:hypothetical protein ACFLXT_01980 [Chloroflexota bacterium]
MKENRERLLITSFEKSVRDLAKVFQHKRAFNFSHELELVMYLLMKTRDADKESVDQKGIPIYLARIEWPCISKRSIDMVIWKPGSEQEARSNWGTTRGKLAKKIPLLAAIQIKRGGGNVTSIELTKKDTEDLDKIYANDVFQKPLLYFIEYADEDLNEDDGDYDTYIRVKNYLKSWCSENPKYKRAFLISRDRIGFAFPKDRWLINPLPKGTKEEK